MKNEDGKSPNLIGLTDNEFDELTTAVFEAIDKGENPGTVITEAIDSKIIEDLIALEKQLRR